MRELATAEAQQALLDRDNEERAIRISPDSFTPAADLLEAVVRDEKKQQHPPHNQKHDLD